MKFLKFYINRFMIFFLFFISFSNIIFAQNNTPTINARYAIVLDRKSNSILFGKNEKVKAKMASTTKIMTAIIVLENSNLDDIVTISKKASSIRGSRLGLKENDKISVHDLLYGLLLKSGNDCAIALAEHVGGDIKNFCELMNSKAKNLNLNNTNFESPHGLDSEKHYTSAYELALLTNYALNNPTFMQIVGTKFFKVKVNDSTIDIKNSNELLGYLDGIYGVKTGFTNGANRCLVAAYNKNNFDIITVVLGCDNKKNRSSDTINLINYIENSYINFNVNDFIEEHFFFWKKDNIKNIKINKSKENNLFIDFTKNNYDSIPIKKESIDNLKLEIDMPYNFNSPINANTNIGNLRLISNNNIIYNSNIYVLYDVPKKSFIDYILELFSSFDFLFNDISVYK